MEAIINGGQKVPFLNRILIKEQEVLNIVDQMRIIVPEEIKQARRINQDKERILAQAQAEATRLITTAQEQATGMLSEKGLLSLAEQRSAEIIKEAEAHADEIREGADEYAAHTLHSLEEQLALFADDIGKTLLSVKKGLEALDSKPRI